MQSSWIPLLGHREEQRRQRVDLEGQMEDVKLTDFREFLR